MADTTQPKELSQDEQVAQADRLYEQFAKPLEKEHPGEFLAVSPTGKTLLAPGLYEATQ